MEKHPELSVSELRAAIDPESLPFEDAASLESLEERIIGQERAIEAMKFGMGMKKPGYNIFLAGSAKTGLTYTAKTFIEEQAKKEPTPPDWCYVYNFKEPDNPRHLKTPAGMGKELKKDMGEFIRTLQAKIPEVFDSDDYHAKEGELQQTFEKQRREMIEELAKEAKEEGFILQFSQVGMVLIPATPEGEPMNQESLRALGEEAVAALRTKSEVLHEKMKDVMKRIQQMEGEIKEKRAKLDGEIALFVVGQLMDKLEEKYSEQQDLLDHLRMVQTDIIESIDDFKKKPEAQQGQPQPGAPFPPGGDKAVTFKKYDVNVLVDNSETEGAPVVVESNPAYPNIFGSIERQAWFGALFTDHTMIKAGAIHRANGGYLVMKALDLLRWGISYEALKRALNDRVIKIEDMGELYGFFGTRSIKPEPIPFDVKIVLTGDPYIYQLLYAHDERFPKLFKVKAHMDSVLKRADSTAYEYARMMARLCKENDLRRLDRTGVARVIEYGMERTDDQDKLTLEIGDIEDLLMEADYFASVDGAEMIGRKHVEEAVRKRIHRSDLVEEHMKEMIEKDVFWVETDGSKVGQVNGLSVLMTGDHVFGKPSRITASVSVGREGAVSIDREAKMSGNIHTKGLLTLGGFLRERFAQNKPISLNASLSFEQSYGMVDGDSASSTELYVLLSAISKIPIFQGIAVTGSVSQKGEVQPIGGVNHKIKGFFDICKHKGLTGKQGVMIPSKNVRNLMLDQEVVDAVAEGKFHIWPVTTIEEGIEILTGVEAGELQPDGTYPEGTVFRKVDDRLKEIMAIIKEYGQPAENGHKPEGEEGGGCPSCGK